MASHKIVQDIALRLRPLSATMPREDTVTATPHRYTPVPMRLTETAKHRRRQDHPFDCFIDFDIAITAIVWFKACVLLAITQKI